MKLSFIVDHLELGGVSRCLLNLTEALSQAGADVELVRITPRGALRESCSPQVRVIDLNASSVRSSVPRIARYLRRSKPDVVFSAKDYVNVMVLAAKRLACAKCRVVPTVHTTISEDAKRQTSPTMRLVPWLARKLYPRADHIVAVSKGVAADLKSTIGASPDKISVIYNPVVTDRLFAQAQEPAKHRWIEDTVPVIVACGRLSAQKNYPLLLNAFRKLLQRKRARLIVIGEGPERAALERQVSSLEIRAQVDFVGSRINPYPLIAGADTFCLSSAWEGFGIVLVEALALGVPVVSTDCPSGPAEILDKGKFGWLVPAGDAAALCDALAAALESDGSEREARKKRARDFAAAKIAGKYFDLAKRLCRG